MITIVDNFCIALFFGPHNLTVVCNIVRHFRRYRSENTIKGNMFQKVIVYDNNIRAKMHFDYIGWTLEFTDNPLTRYVNMPSFIADAAYPSDNNICSALMREL